MFFFWTMCPCPLYMHRWLCIWGRATGDPLFIAAAAAVALSSNISQLGVVLFFFHYLFWGLVLRSPCGRSMADSPVQPLASNAPRDEPRDELRFADCYELGETVGQGMRCAALDPLHFVCFKRIFELVASVYSCTPLDSFLRDIRPLVAGAYGRVSVVTRRDDGHRLVVKQINVGKMTAKEREGADHEARAHPAPTSLAAASRTLRRPR